MPLPDFDLIAALPRSPEKRSTTQLLSRFVAAGHHMTPRSLQRRLISLSSKHPIICDDRAKPYGWSIAPHAPPTLGAMSTQEAVALKLAERYLRDAIPADLLDDLKHYFKQADAKLQDASLYRAWLGKVRLIPATQPLKKPDIKRQVLANAYSGVLRGTVLNVTYKVRDSDIAKTYDIEPLAIVLRGQVSYIVAQFPWASEVTLMALHRFSSIRMTEQPIQPRLKFDLDSFIGSGALGFMPTKEQKIHIRFYEGAGAHLYETPLSVSQILKQGERGQIDLIDTLPITEQLKWWLMGFGDTAEVIAPKALRSEFAARLKIAAARYKN